MIHDNFQRQTGGLATPPQSSPLSSLLNFPMDASDVIQDNFQCQTGALATPPQSRFNGSRMSSVLSSAPSENEVGANLTAVLDPSEDINSNETSLTVNGLESGRECGPTTHLEPKEMSSIEGGVEADAIVLLMSKANMSIDDEAEGDRTLVVELKAAKEIEDEEMLLDQDEEEGSSPTVVSESKEMSSDAMEDAMEDEESCPTIPVKSKETSLDAMEEEERVPFKLKESDAMEEEESVPVKSKESDAMEEEESSPVDLKETSSDAREEESFPKNCVQPMMSRVGFESSMPIKPIPLRWEITCKPRKDLSKGWMASNPLMTRIQICLTIPHPHFNCKGALGWLPKLSLP